VPTETSRKPRLVDSLRLAPAERAEILQLLTEREARAELAERRRELRLPYEYQVEIIPHAAYGTSTHFIVQARNLTSRGVGFLHGTFMYTGTTCSVWLQKLDDQTVACRGRVVRCQLVRRNIHDIGLRLDKRIALGEFINGADTVDESDGPETDRQGGPLFSDLWADARLRPLVRSLVPRLREQILEAGRMVSRDQSNLSLQKLCLEIKGSAAGYGYPRISTLAGQLLDLVLSDHDAVWQRQIMTELIELGRAASQAIDTPSSPSSRS
jgi:hypothetical protein